MWNINLVVLHFTSAVYGSWEIYVVNSKDCDISVCDVQVDLDPILHILYGTLFSL